MFEKIEDLEKFVSKFEKSELTYLYLEYNNFKLKLDKRTAVEPDKNAVGAESAAALESASASTPINGEAVTAPLVGVYYNAPSGGSPYVSVGTTVKKGQVICAIEAMKMMNDIVSPCDGVVAEILAENGKMVEYGQKLMIIEKSHD